MKIILDLYHELEEQQAAASHLEPDARPCEAAVKEALQSA